MSSRAVESEAAATTPQVERCEPVGSPSAAHGVSTVATAARMLALQRTVGNAAVVSMLARTGPPLSRRVLARNEYEHQWENPALVDTIYPARERMLRRFVDMYREIELMEMTDPDQVEAAAAETRAAMQQELDRLENLGVQSEGELAKVKELTKILERGVALADALRWRRGHPSDETLGGGELMAEVKRLFGTSAVPDWLEPLVLDYSGMRYKSAHRSYYSPVRLLYVIDAQRGTWAAARESEQKAAKAQHELEVETWKAKPVKGRGKRPRKPKKVKVALAERLAVEMPNEEALSKLETMRNAGEIPDWAWHTIVRLTELRTTYGGSDWEDTSKEQPDPADTVWIAVMKAWTGKKRVGTLGYGVTGWRSEMQRRNALVTTRMVCNELAEASQRQRGVKLAGGISRNASQYARAGTRGGYLRNVDDKKPDDLRSGATLFWVDPRRWAPTEPDASNKVVAVSGIRYRMPATDEYIAEFKAWKIERKPFAAAQKAWEKQHAKAKRKRGARRTEALEALGPKPANGPTEPHMSKTELSTDDNGWKDGDGWTYTVTEGVPITRSKGEGEGEVVQWMRWRHQATVLQSMSDGRVFTFETLDAEPGRDEKLSASGFRTRRFDELKKQGALVGFIPDASAGAPTPAEEEAQNLAEPIGVAP